MGGGSLLSLQSTSALTHIPASQKAVRRWLLAGQRPNPAGLVSGCSGNLHRRPARHCRASAQKRRTLRNGLLNGGKSRSRSFLLSLCHLNPSHYCKSGHDIKGLSRSAAVFILLQHSWKTVFVLVAPYRQSSTARSRPA